MSSKHKTHYTSRLSVHITDGMSQRLDQIAIQRDEAKAEIVRSALRVYLDQQEDLIGSRKHFTKMFQRRMTYVERLQSITLWLNIQMMHILMERIKREKYDLDELMAHIILSGVGTEDGIFTLVEEAVVQKPDLMRKPPTD